VLDRVRELVHAIEHDDEAEVREAVLRLSRSRRWLTPLAFAVGAFAMLFEGLKLLVSNWRLTIIQVLPAMWISLAMLDLKIHVLHGKSFVVRHGLLAAAVIAAITAITAAAFARHGHRQGHQDECQASRGARPRIDAFATEEPAEPPGVDRCETRRAKRRRVASGHVSA
jgi:Zn-dependent protease with chaperone function